MNNKFHYGLLAILIIIGLLFSLEPFGYMPDKLYMTIATLTLSIGVVLSLSVMRDHPVDEREEAIKSSSDQNAFIVGLLGLSVAITFQAYNGHHDKLLAGLLSLMLIAKLVSLIYYRNVK